MYAIKKTNGELGVDYKLPTNLEGIQHFKFFKTNNREFFEEAPIEQVQEKVQEVLSQTGYFIKV